MSYILGGKKLRQGKPFTHNGIQYPANWLKLSTSEDKAALGITWQIQEDTSYNPKWESSRGVWRTDLEDDGPDPNTGVTTTGLRTQHKEYQNKGAYDLLSPTDWYVTRKSEVGTAIPVGITSFRNAVRITCESRKVAISSATSVESLCGITTFPTLAWPKQSDYS